MARNKVRLLGLPLGVFLFALFLRTWGITNGMPYVQTTDESSDITTSLNLAQGDIPEYTYHRVVWSLFQLPLHGLHFVYNKITQPDYGFDSFEADYFTDRDNFIVTTRIYGAIWASLTCSVVYFIGLFITQKEWPGLLAGILLAVHPAHVYLSHIALPDAFGTFWVALNLLAVIMMIKSQSRWSYILAGTTAALAILTRLQTLTLVLPVVVMAHVIAWRTLSDRPIRFLIFHWLWIAGSFIAANIVFNPFIVIAPQHVRDDIQFIVDERFSGDSSWHPEVQQSNILDNAQNNLDLPVQFIRPYILIAALFAAAVALYRRQASSLLIAGAFFFFVISVLVAAAPRITYWLPSVIPGVIVIATGLFWLWKSESRIFLFAAVAVLIGLSIIETVKIDTVLAKPNTQELAYDFITHNIPADESVIQGNEFIYSVPLSRNMVSIRRLENQRDLAPLYDFILKSPQHLRQPAYDIFGPEYRDVIRSVDDMTRFLLDNHIHYVIETSYCDGQTSYELVGSSSFPIIDEELRPHLTLRFSASPFETDQCEQVIDNRLHMVNIRLSAWERVGPIIRVYRVNLDSVRNSP